MKKKTPYIFCVLMILLLSACGPAPAPTLSVADLQSTAIADAWAAVTLTQAAIPTSTPTLTPAPTETPVATFVVVPTIQFMEQPTLAGALPTENPAADPCNNPPPVKPLGTTVQVKFLNKSAGKASLSFGMLQPNKQNECGTYNFYIGKSESSVVTVLAGCYWAYAYIDSPPSDSKSPQNLCVTDTSKIVAIWIGSETINFH